MRSLAERLSVSPGDARSRPAGPPLGALATWAIECGALLSDADVAEVYRVLRAGGRPAVRAALNVAHRAPPRLRARLVVEAFAERVAVPAFQVLLVWAWIDHAESLLAAAGDGWPALFAYADLPAATLPFVRECVRPRAGLPETFTAYRGGRAEPAALAAGPSWTPSLPWAAHYAAHTRRSFRSGRYEVAPVVLRREVARADVLAALANSEEEVVLRPGGPWHVETEAAEAIAALAGPVAAGLFRVEKEHAARRAAILAVPEAELWQGWPVAPPVE